MQPEHVVHRLQPADESHAVALLRRLLGNASKSLEELSTEQEGPTTEDRRYQEAGKILQVERFQAFLSAMESGDYALDDDLRKTRWPEGLAHMRVACAACALAGKTPELVALIDKRKYGLDKVEVFAEERRVEWLGSVAARFNGQPERERRAQIERHDKGTYEDKQLRATTFPSVTWIDRESATIVLKH